MVCTGLVPGDRELAPAESGAVTKVEAMAALKTVADDETGGSEGITIPGRWGEVPDDVAESLQAGDGIAGSAAGAAGRPRERLSDR